MSLLSLIWGILAFLGLAVAFIPCLGALNWLNIPFSIIGLAISIAALAKAPPGQKGMAIAGTVLCAAAVAFGLFRLLIGGGVL